jgi:hypothetical protein
MAMKDFAAYRTNYLRQDKSLRDHGITESGMVSGVHTDADDMCVSAVNAAWHAASGTPAIQQDA